MGAALTIDWVAIGSIGTLLLFVVGFVAIVIERLDRARSARRQQAEHISAWIADGTDQCESPRATTAMLLNGSTEPVYRVIAWLVRLQGGGGPTTGEAMAQHLKGGRDEDSYAHWEQERPETLSVLPPGRSVVCLPDWDGGMYAMPGVEIAFTDTAGRHWIRRAEGRLEAISKEPANHYSIGLPQDWTLPTQAPE